MSKQQNTERGATWEQLEADPRVKVERTDDGQRVWSREDITPFDLDDD